MIVYIAAIYMLVPDWTPGSPGALEQKINAAFDVLIAVVVEMQLGDVAETQAGGQLVAQVMPGVLQGCQRLLLLLLVSPDHHADIGVASIRTDMHLGHLDGQQARVGGFEADDFGQLFADRFGDS
ncbi:hypothetical protein SBA4_80010 [Candidatus Sulfopaludibacter sp. SbA4]|nr:hypothetical protein SBA4_80010 [Candidatus Sulfopaludibacter sp. SbA4]